MIGLIGKTVGIATLSFATFCLQGCDDDTPDISVVERQVKLMEDFIMTHAEMRKIGDEDGDKDIDPNDIDTWVKRVFTPKCKALKKKYPDINIADWKAAMKDYAELKIEEVNSKTTPEERQKLKELAKKKIDGSVTDDGEDGPGDGEEVPAVAPAEPPADGQGDGEGEGTLAAARIGAITV